MRKMVWSFVLTFSITLNSVIFSSLLYSVIIFYIDILLVKHKEKKSFPIKPSAHGFRTMVSWSSSLENLTSLFQGWSSATRRTMKVNQFNRKQTFWWDLSFILVITKYFCCTFRKSSNISSSTATARTITLWVFNHISISLHLFIRIIFRKFFPSKFKQPYQSATANMSFSHYSVYWIKDREGLQCTFPAKSELRS